jgi:hypothetical protein
VTGKALSASAFDLAAATFRVLAWALAGFKACAHSTSLHETDSDLHKADIAFFFASITSDGLNKKRWSSRPSF